MEKHQLGLTAKLSYRLNGQKNKKERKKEATKMKIIPCAFHKNNSLSSTIYHSMSTEAIITGVSERLPYKESEYSSLEPNDIGYLVVNEAMMKAQAHMTKREELDVMTIEQMSSEVIRRYGYEAKRTISFFRIVERGDYEKIVKAYHKIMK